MRKLRCVLDQGCGRVVGNPDITPILDYFRIGGYSGVATECCKLRGMIKLGLGQFEPDRDRLEAAHKHCSLHRVELQNSSLCGCFYCFAIFAPGDISEWIDEGQTAQCPKCTIDSVIGSASGYPITAEFLHRMYDKWF